MTYLQIQEINGRLPFDKGLYHTPLYNDLMKTLIETRQIYAKTRENAERILVAKQEIDAWKNYIDARKHDLPIDFQIEPGFKDSIKDLWERYVDMKTNTLAAPKLVDFHADLAKKFKFQIPLDPQNITKMIMPFQGYMCAYPGKSYHLSEMMRMYDTQLVSSFERSLGQELLGDEISCFGFWNLVDSQLNGYLTFKQFEILLKMFRFEIQPYNLEEVKKEFKSLIFESKQEIRAKDSQDDLIFRFDFARRLFLERGL